MAERAGVYQSETGDWQWGCGCGAAGGGVSREVAREQYKKHRSGCSLSSKPEAQVMTKKKETAASAAPPAAKKTAAKAKTKATPAKRKPAVTEAAAKAAFDRIQKQKSTVHEESKALGFSYNGPLRKAIVAIVGKDKYFAAIGSASRKPKAKTKAAAEKAPPAAEVVSTPEVVSEGATA